MSSTAVEKFGLDVETGSKNEKHGNGHESADSVGIGYSEGDEFAEVQVVKQGLHQRHIQMIALAGTIVRLRGALVERRY